MNEAVNPKSSERLSEARLRRYAAVDLAGIRVRRAQTEADFALVARLREAGFSRVADQPPASWIDDFDRSPGVFSLVAYDALDRAIGTIRLQDGRISNLELQRFVPLDSLLSLQERPVVQVSRLSVIRDPEASSAMIALFKAVWLWCVKEDVTTIVMASPPWVRAVYDYLLFDDCGPLGQFRHDFAGGALHVSMKIPVARPLMEWPVCGHPLSHQFNAVVHPDLVV